MHIQQGGTSITINDRRQVSRAGEHTQYTKCKEQSYLAHPSNPLRLIYSTIVKDTPIAGNPPSLPSWSQTKGLGLVRRIYTKAVNRCVLSRAHKMIQAGPPSCRQGGLAGNKYKQTGGLDSSALVQPQTRKGGECQSVD